MKFTDGYWNIRQGFQPNYASQVHDVDIDVDSLTIYAPTKRLNHRGDTLNLPILTVRFSSPMPDVIRVQLWHHKGTRQRKPVFHLESQPASQVVVQDGPQSASLTSGRLSVQVEKAGDWQIDFKDSDKLITSSGWRGMGFVDTPSGRYIHDQLSLGVGECVYGLGERFTAFVKNGQVIDLWNEDGGTSSEQAYKNIPFYLTNHGYGVFINHPEKVSLEVGSEKVERVQFSVPGEYLEYFVIYGPDPKDVLSRYTALTGRPALPPAWSFGLWLTTSFTTSYDENTVTGFIQGMAERNIPLHVFHFDCFWMKEFHWCNFEWDQRCFPDPQAMLSRLKARGLHICVWINSYVAQRSALFDEGMANGYLVKRADGSVWQWDKWQAGMGLVDFTNPDACLWFGNKLRALVDMGVDCFKTDFGERIPTDVVWYDGSDPLLMHNYYTLLYNQVVFEVLEEKLGKGAAAVFARSATTGGQKFPVHWGGDSTATFESMAESLRGGLSLSLSGFGFWSHDMGGFEQTASANVYKRWCAFGLLSSHSRLHGSSSYRVPWLFDEAENFEPGENAVDVLRFFTRLKCMLMPYLFQAAVQAHTQGIPVMRAMVLQFPDDPACDTLDREYMLGNSLLVAPVFTSDGTVNYYLPVGLWTNFITGKVVEGGRWVREQHGFLSLPLMACQNSIIPVGTNDQVPDYDFLNGITYHVFGLEDGVDIPVTVPDLSGNAVCTAHFQRVANQIEVLVDNGSLPWSVQLRGEPTVKFAVSGQLQHNPLGILIHAEEGCTRMVIELS